MIATLAIGMILVGCGDPIYDSFTLEPVGSPRIMEPRSKPIDYEWPLVRQTYAVVKPPPMAYVTSFAEPLRRPDPVAAKLVPWSEDGLDERAKKFLRFSYEPFTSEPNVVATLTGDEVLGPQAFDISADGARMVVIDDRGLALYQTEKGELIERVPMPDDVQASEFDAVRFCGGSNDLLVASSKEIIRINLNDKSVTRAQGCGEPIAKWVINREANAMVIQTQSGRVLGGDPNLQHFPTYPLGSEQSVEDVSLSPDGKRIGVCINGKARVYLQNRFQTIGEIDYDLDRESHKVSVAQGESKEVWADGDGLFYTELGEDGRRTTRDYPMLWRPLQASPCFDGSDYFLLIGNRYVRGREQLALFDYEVVRGNHSLPTVLERLPMRVAHDQHGARVALFDSKGLHLIHRDVWRTRWPKNLRYWVRLWIKEDKIDVLVKLLQIIDSQSSLGFGRTSEGLRHRILDEIASTWRDMETNDQDNKMLKRLEQWCEQGGQFALTVSAVRHHKAALTSIQVGETDRSEMALQELDRVIAMRKPPLIALTHRIEMTLEQGGDLAEVDAMCRQAIQLYPGELEPHLTIALTLLPERLGQRGDTISFAHSASSMFQRRDGDLLYARLLCKLKGKITVDDLLAWKSYDANRAQRGFDEYVRRDMSDDGLMWNFWKDQEGRASNRRLEDQVMAYLMEHQASFPYSYRDLFRSSWISYDAMPFYAAMQRVRTSRPTLDTRVAEEEDVPAE